MLAEEYLSIWSTIPTPDPIERDDVMAKLRLLSDDIRLHGKLRGNIFRNAANAPQTQAITQPYAEIEAAELLKKWWCIRNLTLNIGKPSQMAKIPPSEIEKLTLLIDKRSATDAKKLSTSIDFRRSIFLLDESTRRLKWD
jgi:hypothetical protein